VLPDCKSKIFANTHPFLMSLDDVGLGGAHVVVSLWRGLRRHTCPIFSRIQTVAVRERDGLHGPCGPYPAILRRLAESFAATSCRAVDWSKRDSVCAPTRFEVRGQLGLLAGAAPPPKGAVAGYSSRFKSAFAWASWRAAISS
jgi:hypothetical protein